jgi:uncharacterized protein YfaS (alpha-2-macroglobulin family)
MIKKSILAVAGLFFLLLSPAVAQDRATIELFSPEGVVKGVRQVTARFSEQMVSFGDPRLADPFEIRCPEKGQGRWIDGKNWSFDFERDLPAGIICEFALKPGIKTISGKEVTGRHTFRFSTGGPAVKGTRPWEGNEAIDEKQIFVLVLDAEAREESILKHVFLSVQGIKEQVGIRLIKGKEREEILQTVHPRGKDSVKVWLKKLCYRIVSEPVEDSYIVLLQAKQSFPPSAEVKLVWGAGVESASGVATAQDQVLSYKTRISFKAEFSCGREKPGVGCIPVLPMRLYFSAPVSSKMAKQIVLKSKRGKVWKPKVETETEEDVKFVRSFVFEGPFPEKTSFSIVIPKSIRDDAGRTLSNLDKFPLEVRTHTYPPLAKFSSRFGIIELKGDRLLPVTVRNIEADIKTRMMKVVGDVDQTEFSLSDSADKTRDVSIEKPETPAKEEPGEITQRLESKVRRIPTAREDHVIEWLTKVSAARREDSLFKSGDVKARTIPKPQGSKAFEVMGIPLSKAGFYVVELESQILGNRLLAMPETKGTRKGSLDPLERQAIQGQRLNKFPTMYVHTSALVTNLSAHFKWGRESSLVWVTSLDKALPVKGANVSISDCKGTRIWQGKTDERGVASIKTALPSIDIVPHCTEYGGLFVFAKTADDMTFTHSSWDQGIEPWRFQLPTAYNTENGGIIAHTILDRSLFRAGETVHMKHIMRVHITAGFTQVPQEKRPNEIMIEHQGSDEQYRFPLSWHGKGIAESTWKIPENAKLGTYQIILGQKRAGVQNTHYRRDLQYARTSGSFRVEEFRVPLMKGIVQAPPLPLIRPKEVNVDVSVSYLSGGGASFLPVRLRAEMQESHVSFPDFGEYSFAGGLLKEGVVSSSDQQDTGEADTGETETGEPVVSGKLLRFPTQELKLDEAGAARAKFTKLPYIATPKDIHVELEFRDPNGEVQTAATKVAFYPANVLVGIRPDSWVASKDLLKYKIAVVDLKGKPVQDKGVTVDLFQEKIISHRVRLVGGFYAYRHTTEIKRIGRHFSGKTDAKGILFCEGKSPVSGSVILHAEVKDEAGNTASANYTLWVAGKDDWWFEARNDDRIDVLPERKRYEPGDTARFQVRMPFRVANALVTVEREGIVDFTIQKLSGKMPVIEIPVKKNYAPNVFVSVLVVRGRVGGTRPTATFDPGKPAYKIGIGEINVGWRDHELKVEVTTNKKVFKIREDMDIRVKVRKVDGKLPPKGSEVAIAAVDEGLLLLMPNESWKLLNTMMGRRAYEVTTSTAQAMVVGKRHFGLKALPHGGGGGKQITRELFDTLLLWKGRVFLDDSGEATVKIPLNDSLTGFRIVAVANGGMGLFGTGEASVRTTQDLMLLPGIPQLVREGDKFQAGFTVRNASERTMDVQIELAFGGKEKKKQEAIYEKLPAGAAKEISWPITVPFDINALSYEVTAKEKGTDIYDRLKVSQKVTKAVPTRTFQATLTQIRNEFRTDIEKPSDAVAGRGGVYLQVKPVLAHTLAGVREYMAEYPYTCLEQKVSRAVALRNGDMWQSLMKYLPSYLDSDGLLKYFPPMRQGSDVLTAYVLAVAHEADYKIPAYLQNRMTSGLWGFIEGRVIRYGAMPTADLAIRKIAAVEALARYEKVHAKLISSIRIEPNLWPTSAVINWISILTRAEDIKDRDSTLQEARQIVRSRLNLQGTTMGFSTEVISSLWWLMESLDSTTLKAILVLLPFDEWREDIPRMATGALGRMRRGHWNTTTANAWGVLALEKFSKKFEATPVTGTMTARIRKNTMTVEWGKTPEGGEHKFPWPRRKETLSIEQKGTGAPWALIRSMAAIPLKEPFSSGYTIKKTVTPVEQKVKGTWSRGDILRVNLDMEAQSDMTWVVVSDPIPAGSSIMRADMGGSSLLTAGERSGGWAWLAFTERSFEVFRNYYEYVPKGKWTTEYTIRLNNEGTFHLPATRVEALYAPEMFGEIPNKEVEIHSGSSK